MNFKKAAKLSTYLSKDYAEEFFKLIGFSQIMSHYCLCPHFNSRINKPVEQVNCQVGQNYREGEQHEHTLEEGIISL